MSQIATKTMGGDGPTPPKLIALQQDSVEEQEEKLSQVIKAKYRVGLRKIRNSCYMNSILQTLFHVDEFRHHFLSGSWSQNPLNIDNKEEEIVKAVPVSIALRTLFASMAEGSVLSVSPYDFKTVLDTSKCWSFARNEQQDAYEFLIALLSKLGEELKQVNDDGDKEPEGSSTLSNDHPLPPGENEWKAFVSENSSFIAPLFFGQQKSINKCTVCGEDSVTYEPILGLPLAIPQAEDGENVKTFTVTLSDCLTLFFSEESILDWDCPKCQKKTEVVRKLELCRLPKYLVIKLKRIIYGEGGRRGRLTQKVHTLVNFPVEGFPFAGELYDLVGVVDHVGQEFSGHYTTSCKEEDNGEWAYFNDSRVLVVDKEDIVTDRAVLLFYKMRL